MIRKNLELRYYRYAFRQERDYLGKIAQQERISLRLSGFI